MQGHLLTPPSLINTAELLGTPGRCFYIPPYQRHFAWNKGDIERFFESMVFGIRSMASSEQSVGGLVSESFMGTVVCFETYAPYEPIQPKVDNDYPTSILILIDGQQRLTVCLALATVLHHFLDKAKLADIEGAQEEQDQFDDFIKSTQGELYNLLRNLSQSGDRPYYPRMIRGFEDRWSKTKEKSIYNSPISELLSSYIDHTINDSKKQFKFKRSSHGEHAKELAPTINRFVKWLATDTDNNDVEKYSFGLLPDIVSIFQNDVMQRDLFDLSVPIDPFTPLQQKINDVDGKQRDKLMKVLSNYKKIARIITFSKYFLKRVKFIQMITTSTDYAFTIFDALNTTGDPLTAFETFKPEVMKVYEKTKDYEQSPLRRMMDEIDEYLKVEKTKQEKKTKELIVNFALAENGEKLSKALNRQRQYMNVQYGEQCDLDKNEDHKGEDFIKNLRNVARVNESFIKFKDKDRQEFLNHLEGSITTKAHVLQISEFDNGIETKSLWEVTDNEHEQLSKEAVFCLNFLAAVGHTISIPLIARFYEEFLSSTEKKEQKDKHESLCKAIRSIAAFFVLWRISRIKMDTDNIDSHHRKIMDNLNNDSPPQLNFARNARNKNTPDFWHLKNEFCRLLVNQREDIGDEYDQDQTDTEHQPESEDTTINDDTGQDHVSGIKLSKAKWIDFSNRMPIYDKQKDVAKFILLLNAYWPNRDNINNNLFNRRLWFHEAHKTVEHILPQKLNNAQRSVDEEILIDAIGNLTLLPSKVNSWIGNLPWEKRKKIYAILSANDDEVHQLCESLDLDKKNEKQLLSDREKIKELYPGHYMPTIQSIADYEKFDFDVIRERGEEILDSVWEPLIEWLGADIYKEEGGDNHSEN